MSTNSLRARTAITPIIWGTTYLVTTEFLPTDRPFHAAFFRAAIAGILLALLARQRPPHGWWWRSLVLGTLNIGAFFIFLFVAAYRLPGGLAATVGALSPILVALLGVWLLGERITGRTVISGILGVVGVGLLVLRADAQLDAIGLIAALAGAISMAVGLVLTKRWQSPAPLLASTSWQLLGGAIVLAPIALAIDGVPRDLTTTNIAGYLWLGVVGGALAYAVWFRGLTRLSATQVSLLSLLSPVTATLLGLTFANEHFTGIQLIGLATVLTAVMIGQREPSEPQPTPTTAVDAHSDESRRSARERVAVG